MRYRLVWTRRAQRRLTEIAEYIASDRPSAAKALLERLFQRVELLAELPRTGRPYPGADEALVREVTFEDYRIIYRLSEAEKTVLILTVRHVRQAPLPPGELG